MNEQEFLKEVLALRKQSKRGWYAGTWLVNGKEVQIKGYNTWLQIFRVDGLTIPTSMGQNVGQMRETLLKGVTT